MRHPYFHKAIMEAYENLIPAGEQISYFVYFEIDPASIDVNIHPTKTEIKFENEQAIWQILAAAVKESLGKFNAIPSIDFDTEGMPDIPVFGSSDCSVMPETSYNPDYNPFASSETDYAPNAGSTSSRKDTYIPNFEEHAVPSGWESLYEGISSSESSASQNQLRPDGPADGKMVADTAEMHMMSERASQYYQFKGRYILTSVKSGLMIIEQTRAHVRVLYDRYLSQIEKHQGISQGILFPEVIQFPASEAVILEGILDDLQSIGFDLSNLGGGSYSLNGIPSDIAGIEPAVLLRNLVNTAKEKGHGVREEIIQALALEMAKAAAIVPGQVLSTEEMNELVDALFSCQTPNYTPDGKIILSVISGDEIDKLF